MKIPSSITVLCFVLAVLSPAWKDWERKASNFPPEVTFQLYSFHWTQRMVRCAFRASHVESFQAAAGKR